MNPQPQGVNSPFQASTNVHHISKKKGTSASVKGFFSSNTFLLIVIAVLLGIIIYLLNPARLYSDFQNREAVKSVSQLVQVPDEEPVIAVVTDADNLRGENSIQAEVYKDATNGDYVIGYSDRMIIYRKKDNQIIYDGDTPQMRLQKAQQAVINEIIDVIKNAGLISKDSTETPQISIITDATTLKEQDAKFYANARTNDVLVLFPKAELIVIYNPQTKEIINSGSYETEIK